MKGNAVYEVVEAKTREEALAKSMFKPGLPVVVQSVKITPNSDGTFTVVPSFIKK